MPEVVDLTKSLSRTEKRKVRTLKALVFEAKDGETPESATRTISEEAIFASVANRVVPPPVNASVLSRIVENSSVLGPPIEAMETNIELFGHRFVPRVPESGLDDESKAEMAREKIALSNAFASLSDNGPFIDLRRRVRHDYETNGYAFVEAIRGASGRLMRLRHIPAPQVRLSLEGDDFVQVDEPTITIGDDGAPTLETVKVWKRFRTFVQGNAVFSGGAASIRHRWFKQFGDPRTLDSETGEFVPESKVKAFPKARAAGELYYITRYNPLSPYGLPRWWGAYLNVLGIRESEEINYSTFSNNMIPSMAFLVSNGMLTQQTIDRIQELIDTRIAGKQNRSAFLIIEAESAFEGEDGGQVKLDIKPLQQYQHGDAMFLGYSKWNVGSVMRSFRLFPLFVGDTSGLNRSIAEIGRRLADEQVFAPERSIMDWHINRLVLLERGYRWHRFESRSPNVTDNRELIAMLVAAERTGGINPALGRAVVEDVFPQAGELPSINPEKLDPEVPYSLQLAERMKNLANSTEPGQTIAPSMPPQDPGEVVGKSDDGYEAVAQMLLDLNDLTKTSLAELRDVDEQ